MSAENRAKLIDIVATLLELEPAEISDATSPQTVDHWDSLNHLNLCVATGQEFGVELTVDEMTSVKRVGDLVRLLNEKGISCA